MSLEKKGMLEPEERMFNRMTMSSDARANCDINRHCWYLSIIISYWFCDLLCLEKLLGSGIYLGGISFFVRFFFLSKG